MFSQSALIGMLWVIDEFTREAHADTIWQPAESRPHERPYDKMHVDSDQGILNSI